ncbi:MAG: UDP-N-acetylmuramoyl-tripeptide--D-alanyl-D-alanine ligase [Bacillota bacterium]
MLNIKEVTEAVKGCLLTGDGSQIFGGVTTDSRRVVPGTLFVALIGQKHDAHQFVGEALDRGAAGAIVSQQVNLPLLYKERTLIRVENTLKALQDLAIAWREQFQVPVVAVTGSNGKTTTKDMIAAVLGFKLPTLKTEANLNNEIGLPLTLLQLKPHHKAVVVEMGMRGLGQISQLCEIARPRIGVITNIGVAHLELLGTVENIARAKGELIEHIPVDGYAMLNGDDPWCRKISQRCRGTTLFYGWESPVQVRASDIRYRGQAGMEFRAEIEGQKVSAFLPAPGEHNVKNALAAIGVGYCLGLTLEEAVQGLANLSLSSMRLQILPGCHGGMVINDAYNANPDSTVASLKVLSNIKENRAVAILGDMYELGNLVERGHYQVGEAASHLGIDILVAVGPLSRYTADGASAGGMDANRVIHCSTKEEALTFLTGILQEGDTVLVKASRGMAMEEIVQGLTKMR